MQSLDVISVNIWQILISLCNLVILFLILKKFLFKPVQKVTQTRRAELDDIYSEAKAAQTRADMNEKEWSEKLAAVKAESDTIIKNANERAARRGEEIVSDAREKADGIVREAQTQADLEHKKAQAQIKKEIADVSSAISEKVLGREISEADHRDLIERAIAERGENND